MTTSTWADPGACSASWADDPGDYLWFPQTNVTASWVDTIVCWSSAPLPLAACQPRAVALPAPAPASIPSLLPANASLFERAFEQVFSVRLASMPAPLRDLWSSSACPVDLLPAMAWGLSVDEWAPLWGEDRRRQAAAQAIPLHKIKGTVASVRRALAGAGYPDAVITEGAVGWRYGPDVTFGPWLIFGGPDDWATYSVDVGRPITAEQVASVQRILDATAPLRCHLAALSYSSAPWVYGPLCVFGSDLTYYGVEGA